MADTVTGYVERLKLVAIYAGAVLALSVATALANRWIGRDVTLPAIPPPVIVVNPDADGKVPSVQVLEPKKE
jgi:hypothetical protein